MAPGVKPWSHSGLTEGPSEDQIDHFSALLEAAAAASLPPTRHSVPEAVLLNGTGGGRGGRMPGDSRAEYSTGHGAENKTEAKSSSTREPRGSLLASAGSFHPHGTPQKSAATDPKTKALADGLAQLRRVRQTTEKGTRAALQTIEQLCEGLHKEEEEAVAADKDHADDFSVTTSNDEVKVGRKRGVDVGKRLGHHDHHVVICGGGLGWAVGTRREEEEQPLTRGVLRRRHRGGGDEDLRSLAALTQNVERQRAETERWKAQWFETRYGETAREAARKVAREVSFIGGTRGGCREGGGGEDACPNSNGRSFTSARWFEARNDGTLGIAGLAPFAPFFAADADADRQQDAKGGGVAAEAAKAVKTVAAVAASTSLVQQELGVPPPLPPKTTNAVEGHVSLAPSTPQVHAVEEQDTAGLLNNRVVGIQSSKKPQRTGEGRTPRRAPRRAPREPPRDSSRGLQRGAPWRARRGTMSRDRRYYQ